LSKVFFIFHDRLYLLSINAQTMIVLPLALCLCLLLLNPDVAPGVMIIPSKVIFFHKKSKGVQLYLPLQKDNMKFALLFLCLPVFAFAQVFKGESVEYDAADQRFLTSDDGISIVQRAADGTISYFGTGFRAKYGMEIMQGRLFALTVTTLYAYDLTTETEDAAIPIPGATFLNGLASDGASLLWATDFSTGKIHQIDVSDLQQPIVTTLVPVYGGTPNGIVHDAANNRLVVASWGNNAQIKAVDLATNLVSTITTTNVSNIDGIDMDGQGNFYIASWSPDRIIRYNSDFSESAIITVPGLNNPADICYATGIDTLAIPNTAGNNILFVGFSPVSPVQNIGEAPIDFTVSPNPVTEASQLMVDSKTSGVAHCSIYGETGNVVFETSFYVLAGSKNRLSLRGFHVVPGMYTCVLRIGGAAGVKKMVRVR